MSKKLKIVTIGGGSSYTPELVEGIINRYEQIPVSELWLVDVEEGREKLETVGALAKRMVKKAGVPMEVHLSYNRREALKDADFVTTQLRVGQLAARALDERIPLKHGVIGQETNGAGGLFKALRTIPVILDICNEVEELCPNAWILNFTNPAGMVTEAALRYSNIKRFIGLCNIPIGMEMGIAKLLNVDHSRVRIDFAGLNHMVFGVEVYLDGVSVKEQVLEMIMDPANASFVKNIDAEEWAPEFLKAINVIPCSYHHYYYKTSEMLERALKDFESNETRAEVVQKIEASLFEKYKDEALDVKPPELEERGGAYYSDAACRLISSIYNDTRDIQPLNTVNKGAISGLPYDSAVEVSCVITKDGPVPLTMGELPVPVRGLIQTIKSFEQTSIEAAIEGNREKAILALTINPLVANDKLAVAIVDEMLEAHKQYLPKFFK
ncbi:6-phospho-beta-glucosidase [Arthrobacter citreus]|nr:6-phospho-beta-glucosidase [Arthrobacter citreus]